eukprot:5518560-Prymnesium_polylepis.1
MAQRGPKEKALQHIGTRKHSKNALHIALEANDVAAAEALIVSGDAVLLNAQVENCGPTPLMLLAMGHCARPSRACAEMLMCKLLEHGGGASIAVRTKSRRTAADYAEEVGGHSAELVTQLRALEVAERQQTASTRCAFCGDALLPAGRSPLGLAARRAAQGDEPNATLRSFFAAEGHVQLLEPALHRLSRLKAVRKELSESLAVLDALDALEPAGTPLRRGHLIDLACGRGFTASLASLRHPQLRVSAIDRHDPERMPHWAGSSSCRVGYFQQDLMDPCFVDRLSQICSEIQPEIQPEIHTETCSERCLGCDELSPPAEGATPSDVSHGVSPGAAAVELTSEERCLEAAREVAVPAELETE